MENDPLLEPLAERYRRRGYTVTVNPGPAALPPFAKDYAIELLAERPDGNVLVSAKPSAEEVARDPTLADLADIVGEQPGWRFDVTLLRPPIQPPRLERRNTADMSREQIEGTISKAKDMYDGGFGPQAAAAAWSAFESAMRLRLRSMGRRAWYGDRPLEMLSDLTSSGEIDQGEFRALANLSELRNVIVHGFDPPPIERGVIDFLGEITHRLLDEAELKTSAT